MAIYKKDKSHKKMTERSVEVTHTCNPSTQGAEAGVAAQIQGQPC